jgi:hypothetical protein
MKLVARLPNVKEDGIWGAVQLCAPMVSESGDTRIPTILHRPRLDTIYAPLPHGKRDTDIEELAERIELSKERVTSLLRKFSSSRKTTL